MSDRRVDILVVGAGVGGCAAALAATSLGRSVVKLLIAQGIELEWPRVRPL